MTDKATGEEYTGLNALLDGGDRGNMWMSSPPEADEVVTSRGRVADVACLMHGPLAASFRIRSEMRVPARYDFAAQRRSAETVALGATTVVTLRKASRFVELATTIENTARDHHLRVCFPTGCTADTTCADGSFSVTEYPARPDLTWELARHPAQLWFDLHDGRRGLAVLSRSMKDYEVMDHDGGQTLAMGLLRGVRLRIPCDNRLWMEYPGDESAQALGTTTHEYALLPHRRRWDQGHLHRAALCFAQPLKCCQFGRQGGRLPRRFSFLAVDEPNLVLSAVRKADDRHSVLARFFNPTPAAIEATITTGFEFAAAYRARLSEERDVELPAKGRSVRLSVRGGEIATVEFAVYSSP